MPLLPPPANAAAAKKRVRERLKMQRYRQRLVDKAVVLKEQVHELEDQLAALAVRRRMSALPWEIVADVMREERCISALTQSSLQTQCEVHTTIIHAMKRWVAKAMSIPSSPSNTSQSWHHVTLMAHPASRKLGFDWITQRLFHSTDYMLERMAFPSSDFDGILGDFTIDGSNPDCFQYVWRSQIDVIAPLEAVRDLFARPNLRDQMTGNRPTVGVHPTALTMKDHELLHDIGATYVHSRWSAATHVHFLAREFNQPHRCVLVAQNIHADECLPSMPPNHRHRTIWLVLDRVAPDRTRVRALCINSHTLARDAGHVSLQDEARTWGCDVSSIHDETTQVQRFNQHVREIADRNGSSFYRRMRDKFHVHNPHARSKAAEPVHVGDQGLRARQPLVGV
ncbi:Aste57867_9800 [Aphanomyces stellatus]|uniref:Aste57867_9800 protein n=1 Tax=Aphanomyces stellatus TaxID=120398 RepID=A0A485KPD2_9STRA|nr:hypothetical protein As57867_009761 [Aphanomyces stellatus]VFT86679.1 Aste57867_9800 [Aphanomyces stellatus]